MERGLHNYVLFKYPFWPLHLPYSPSKGGDEHKLSFECLPPQPPLLNESYLFSDGRYGLGVPGHGCVAHCLRPLSFKSILFFLMYIFVYNMCICIVTFGQSSCKGWNHRLLLCIKTPDQACTVSFMGLVEVSKFQNAFMHMLKEP